jgi:hypothetical protein
MLPWVALPQPADHCRSMFATVIRVHGRYGWLSRRGLHCFQLPVSMPWLLLSDLLSLKKQASSRSQISLRLFLPRHWPSPDSLTNNAAKPQSPKWNWTTRTCVPLPTSLSLTDCHLLHRSTCIAPTSHRPSLWAFAW